ncbi:MAG: hypothetical protein ABH871_04280 [Pseudomonadota bacterium]
MKKIFISVVLIMALFFASCGGSSGGGGGGGGGLTAAQVAVLYELCDRGMPMDAVLPAMLELLVAQCPNGNSAADAQDVNVALGPTACTGGGTWTLSGTMSCYQQVVGAAISLTILTTTNGALALSSCASTVNVDTTNLQTEQTNVTLNGTVSPFAMTNTTIDMTQDQQITINGSATMKLTDMALDNLYDATLTYQSDLTFTDFDAETNSPTCAANTVSATQGDNSGTCTLTADCNCS